MKKPYLAPLALLLVVACSSPGSSGDAGTTAQELTEKEPNDGPDVAGTQALGTLEVSKTIRVKGKLSSGGNDGQQYTGDKDIFNFTLATSATLSVKVDWTGAADVDAALYDANLKALAGDGTTTKPINSSGALPAGTYVLGVFSKDQAADWTLEITAAPSTDGGSVASGPTCGADLYTGWWGRDPCSATCEQYQFHQDGTYAYESFNSVSGTIPGSGNFSIACPVISVNNSDGSSSSFTVQNGVLYEKGNYKYVHCSNGKCF